MEFKRISKSLRRIYTPKYAALNILVAIAYYLFYIYLFKFQNYGIVLYLVPAYFVYALIASASVLFTIAIYSISNTRNNIAKVSGSALGTLTTFAGSIIGGCNCAAPVLFSFVALGFSTSQIIGIIDFISLYQMPLFLLVILLNIVMSVYYLDKLSRPSCAVRRKR